MTTGGYHVGDGANWPGPLHVGTTIPCPAWCSLPPGHPFEDTQLGDGLRRSHEALAGYVPGLSIELTQYESAASAQGPILRESPDVLLRGERGHCVELTTPSADQLRGVAYLLLHLAERLPQRARQEG